MNKVLLTLMAGMLAVGTMLPTSATPSLAQACLGKREIQQAVADGQILPLAQILAAGGIDASSVVSFQVCDRGGGLAYVLQVYEGGEAKTIVLNAATGSQ
ncbi:hypothetical protein GCM10011321_20760 [Youhaiella tibetensis]|uniref:Uncharacterized protein n=1 Tax=Paradevosia tibetensis TaxID=1447062 RepID=A0A5B9DL27_9HYPH|nr:hypothetical protein [Youhaiella tibetensis]QEE19863.1 hypothetical protein FNA67_06615 [Youhaiella tibetensis]GGF29235.1 hypothetical protein GCM10011321_20760 [Youhaiella tibetensis]